ncbi:MAG: ATP-dependent Clp protease ATP-binding subunit [Sandaracinaceae bacterium]|nr:ATP-dependent Clp protease ATP-binding subunit [Sandaracinaceae bacterium]
MVRRARRLPLDLVADERSATVAELAARLREGVIGQDAACAKAAEVLARLEAGLTDPERPIGNLLFAGPTGVGKTELANQLARVLFGDAERITRVDMAEYGAPGAIERLRQVGRGVTSLAQRVHDQPLSLVLLDEIEKAHPEVFDLLLGVLGEGRLTDAMGRQVDSRMTRVVSEAARDRLAALGWHPSRGARPLRRAIEERVFTPLVARIARDPAFRRRRVDVLAPGEADASGGDAIVV